MEVMVVKHGKLLDLRILRRVTIALTHLNDWFAFNMKLHKLFASMS